MIVPINRDLKIRLLQALAKGEINSDDFPELQDGGAKSIIAIYNGEKIELTHEDLLC